MKKKVYLNLNDHVRLTFFKEQAIILDLIKDKYYVLNEKLSSILYDVLSNGYYLEKDSYRLIKKNESMDDSSMHHFIQELVFAELLNKENFQKSFMSPISREEHKSGLENVDWRLPISGVEISVFKPGVLRCFLTLIKVHFCLNFSGFYKLINLIKNKRLNTLNTQKQPSSQDLQNLSDSLNKACLLFPKKIKCLEWSVSFVLMSLYNKWPCNLVIGVQNFPFLAHAWVEYRDKVIFDDELLPAHLSIMLREPFNEGSAG